MTVRCRQASSGFERFLTSPKQQPIGFSQQKTLEIGNDFYARLSFRKKNCFGRKSSSVPHCTTRDHLLHSLLFPYGHSQVIWWSWIHIFCYNDRTWIKKTIQYKLLNDHHILLMGLQWIWLTKELAWGKRNRKKRGKKK